MDDIPHYENELYAAVVLSTHAHATITVDASKAVEMEGVRTYVDVNDIPGSNLNGGQLRGNHPLLANVGHISPCSMWLIDCTRVRILRDRQMDGQKRQHVLCLGHARPNNSCDR